MDNNATHAYDYTHHENGIHEIILHDFSTKGISEYLNLLNRIHKTHTEPSRPILLMINVEQGTLPAQEIEEYYKWLKKEYPSLRFCMVKLIENPIGAFIGNLLIGMFRVHARVFTISQRDAAIVWLLKQR